MLIVNGTTYVWHNTGLQAALKGSPNGECVEIVSDFHTAPLAVRASMVKDAKAAGFEEGKRQSTHAAAHAERARIQEIYAITPHGCDEQAKRAVAEGLSIEQFAYQLTMAAIAGGEPLPQPNSSRKH